MRTHKALLLIFLCCVTSLAQGKKPALVPLSQTIGEGVVLRTSDKQDPHGDSVPPWKEVKITNIFGFKRRPTVGEVVTVVPLQVNISPVDLKITSTKRGAACGETGSSVWWEVELETVKRQDFFQSSSLPNRKAEAPFDVAVIYPAVKLARSVKREDITREMLPAGVALNIVKGAIDLTNDGIPDVLLVEYCCGNPKKAAGECDYICGKTFKRLGGIWKLVRTSSPC